MLLESILLESRLWESTKWDVTLSARWVPRQLPPERKTQRIECALNLLNHLITDSEDFHRRLVTENETWIYQYDPESKIQSKEWLPRGSSGPRKFRAERSAAKVLATVFWDSEGVIMAWWNSLKIESPSMQSTMRRSSGNYARFQRSDQASFAGAFFFIMTMRRPTRRSFVGTS